MRLPYWVQFKHRATGFGNVSEQTRTHRQAIGLPAKQLTDAFPQETSVQAVLKTGAQLRVQSRWFNAISINATSEQIAQINTLDVVEKVESFYLQTYVAHISKPVADTTPGFTIGLKQVNYPHIYMQQLTGKGVLMGLIDAGFTDTDKDPTLSHLFKQKRIVATRDFINPGRPDFFNKGTTQMDDHGHEVLTYIAAIEPDRIVGAANGARFVLARTDDAVRETRKEEDYWLAAVEWMDSLGVVLINSSLGYGLGFDNPAENHKTSEIDGKSTVVTRALAMAVKDKGITVVVSAGNDGSEPAWRIVNAPADAREAISVGATYQNWAKAGYSGEGPAELGYVKPDVSVYSLFGTSFAAPIITGLIGCLMEKYPNLPPARWQQALQQSGHLAHAPNTYLGYGVPNMARLDSILTGMSTTLRGQNVKANGSYQVPFLPPYKNINVYHKDDERHVISKSTLSDDKPNLLITQPNRAKFTTVSTPAEYIEIEWQ